MPEKVSILEDQKIIKVDSYGEVSIADLKHSMEEVIQFHKQYGFTNIFVDASKETSLPSTMPVFEFASELAQIFQKFRFAVVKSPKVNDILRFLENVAKNRGARVFMFETEKEALEWLMSDTD